MGKHRLCTYGLTVRGNTCGAKLELWTSHQKHQKVLDKADKIVYLLPNMSEQKYTMESFYADLSRKCLNN